MVNKLYRFLKDSGSAMLMRLFRAFPIQQNKAVFISYSGRFYNDNPRCVSEELEKHDDVEIVWSVLDGVKCSPKVRTVSPFSVKYIYELATAKVWVDNARKRPWIRKRKGQYYIQTWHGNIGNKRAEKAAGDTLDKPYIKGAIHDAACTDLMLSGSKFFTDLCYEAFWYDGEVLECGTPRLDIFYHCTPEIIADVKGELGLSPDTKVVLYAPTFRQDLRIDCYDMDYTALLDTLQKKYGGDWVVAVRMHPNVPQDSFIQFSDKIINATKYPDLYKLMLASEIIVSDYSSLTFEAGLIKKPVLLFATDVKEYIDERGFYWDMRELPFPLAETNDELIRLVRQFDRAQYEAGIDAFYSKLEIKESGKASKIVADRIYQVMQAGKNAK